MLILDSTSEGSGSGSDHHHRCNSESFLIEEQPSWLDDLLNEPAETVIVHKGHRRSASDTFAYVGTAAERLNTRENNNNVNVGGSSINYVSYKDQFTSVSYDTKPTSAKVCMPY